MTGASDPTALPLGAVAWIIEADRDEAINIEWLLEELPSLAAGDHVAVRVGGSVIDLIALGEHGEEPTGLRVSRVGGRIEAAKVSPAPRRLVRHGLWPDALRLPVLTSGCTRLGVAAARGGHGK